MGDMLSGAAAGATLGSVVPGFGTAIGAGVGALGSLIGGLFGNPKQKYLDAAKGYYDQINPNVTARDVGGIQGTAFNQVDPSTRAAMMGALQTLQQKYRSGGLDATDRAKAAEIQQMQTGQAKANRDAVVSAARRSGTLNSGRALVGQLTGVDAAAKNASDAAVQQAGAAEKARMAALQGTVGTASTIQQGDYTKASANDALNQFNKNLEVGNANRNFQAQQASVQNALGRAGGVGSLAGEAPGTSGTQNTLGQLGQIGAGVADKYFAPTTGKSAPGEQSAADWNQESDQGWKWGDMGMGAGGT